MKTSHLNISNATDKIKSIGFAFVSFEASDPFVDPNGFIELLGDCDLDKPGDVISNGMALKLIVMRESSYKYSTVITMVSF